MLCLAFLNLRFYNGLYEGVDAWVSQEAGEAGCIDDGCAGFMYSVVHGSVELGCFTVDANTSPTGGQRLFTKSTFLGLGNLQQFTNQLLI